MPTTPTLSPATTAVPTPKNTRKKVPTNSAKYFFIFPPSFEISAPLRARDLARRRFFQRSGVSCRAEKRGEGAGSTAGKLKRVPNACRKSLKGLGRSQVKNLAFKCSSPGPK